MSKLTTLPFDLKGNLPSNLIVGEEITLTKVATRTNRVITPKFGAFYADSLTVRTASGTLLTRDKEYVITYYYMDLMELTAREIAAMVVVTDPEIGKNIRLSYQAVGGPYSLNIDEVKELLTLLENPLEPVKWSDIIDPPIQFNPAPHTHEYWQLYGLDTTNICLDLLGQAWRYGNEPVVSVNRAASDAMREQAEETSQGYANAVYSHISDYGNPHKTTPTQLGLEKLSNFRLADPTESKSRTIADLYQPISGVYNQIMEYALPQLTLHIAQKDNPHKLTINTPLIDAYTYQETINLYAGKLRIGEMAASTAALEGRSVASITSTVRSNLGAANILASSTFTLNQIMPGGYWPPRNYPTDYILMGTGYVYFPTLFGEYTVPIKEEPVQMSKMARFISSDTTGMVGTSLRQFTSGDETVFEVYQTVNGESVQLI